MKHSVKLCHSATHSGGKGTFIACLCFFLIGCAKPPNQQTERSAYYWSTTFEVDTSFLNRQHIGRLYVRYFDVVWSSAGQPLPNATITFRSPQPKGVEIVPTIFIVNGVMRHDVRLLADKIVTRVLQMNETNAITGVREIQIDCDWTTSTRTRYNAFMKELQGILQNKGLQLSTTIRLHQLAQTPPPANRGVLMLYNTGDFANLNNTDPILDFRDVKPYLKYLDSYKLPLSAAYPAFSYRLLFRHGKFVGLLHCDDELPVLPTDTIVTRTSNMEQIKQTLHAIDAIRPDLHHEIVVFDLRKNSKSYEEIYHR
ncbi:MAG TPA: hypothetical protein VIQ97_05220 [Prevotella sp.]